MRISNFDSSAVQYVDIIDEKLIICFKSSDKEYTYHYKEELVLKLIKTIKENKSVGKLITKSIKSGDLEIFTEKE